MKTHELFSIISFLTPHARVLCAGSMNNVQATYLVLKLNFLVKIMRITWIETLDYLVVEALILFHE